MWKYYKLHLDKGSKLIIFFYLVAPSRLPWIYIIVKTYWMGKWTKWLYFEIWLYSDNGHRRTAPFLPLHIISCPSFFHLFYSIPTSLLLFLERVRHTCLSVFALTVPSVCGVLLQNISSANLLEFFKHFFHYYLNRSIPSLH